MVSKKDIIEILRQGENSGVEFKTADVKASSIAKEIVGFANTGGGVVLVGVNDSAKIIGIENISNAEEWIANICRENVIPAISCTIEIVYFQDKNILFVKVPKGKDKPYQTNKFRFLIRIGSTNRIATQQELLRLFQESGAFHYDITAVTKTKIKDLNFYKLDSYFSKYNIDFINDTEKENLLVNTDILSENQQVTIGGLLLFGINPQKYLHNAYISFAHFKGTEISDELIDKKNIYGTIDYQVDSGLAVIKNNIKTPSVIKGLKREDTKYLYPDKVFRELLLNAVVHRNYSIHGSRIRIFMFEDRIEFISPGKLPNTVNIEKIKYGVSFARNPVILKFMENLRYIDLLGRGIPMVINEVKKINKKVVFKEIGEEFKVILYL